MYGTKIDRLIEAHIKECGMNHRQFAAASGVPQETLCRIRKGRGVTFDTAYLLACALGITLDDLYQLMH